MSRSGYSDGIENWSLIRWRGAVTSALRGKNGQAFLREALEALDSLPEPVLTHSELEASGEFCVLGAVGRARETPMSAVDADDHEAVARLFHIPHALACEIMFENDEGVGGHETPRQRYERMRRWIVANINADLPSAPAPNQGAA